MDGVLWRGRTPVLDIRALFSEIRDLGCQAYCVTNNSTKTASKYQEILTGFGVNLELSQFVTSAGATADYLAQQFPAGSKLYVIGEEGLRRKILEKGFQVVSSGGEADVSAVVVGLDRDLTYQHLNRATQYIHAGAAFIGTNPDTTFPTPTGFAPGAGAIIMSIEASSGLSPVMIGKPASPLFELALKRAGCSPRETLMIGDRLETDILGAQKLGLRTCLVLTGVTDRKTADSWRPQPERIAENALKVVEELRANDGKLI